MATHIGLSFIFVECGKCGRIHLQEAWRGKTVIAKLKTVMFIREDQRQSVTDVVLHYRS